MAQNYNNFTKMNPVWNLRHSSVQLLRGSLLSTERPIGLGRHGAAVSSMAPTAPNLRRRSCYANSRLLQSPRLRWVQLHWRRLPPRRIGTVVGTAAAGITADGAGVGPASTPEAPAMVMATAVAMRVDWSRPPGVLAGAS